MKRQPLTDDSGRWFDIEAAEIFKESTTWNGNNHISDATGSQWDHEWLYRSASGRWIMNHWSNYQNTMESYFETDDDDAARWLSRNGHNHPTVAQQIAELEM